MKRDRIIVWLRDDLRLADNPALYHAAQQGEVLPVYIFDPKYLKNFGKGKIWWLHQGLQNLQKNLENHLLIVHGDFLKIMKRLVKEYKAQAVFFNECYYPEMMKIDAFVKKELEKKLIKVETFNGSLLWKPNQILKKDGTGYKVYKAFFNASVKQIHSIRPVVSKPTKIKYISILHKEKHDNVSLPRTYFYDSLASLYVVSEQQADKLLKKFVRKNLASYSSQRNYPASDGTSRLSAYLQGGQISVHQIWQYIEKYGSAYATKKEILTFFKELCWREFAYHVLYLNPQMSQKNLYESFNNFSWKNNKKYLKAWQSGQTGYPIVDAGMRELNATGYMHNRVRMIVASFLIKDLLIDWRLGQQHFWQFLVDADLANNSFNWQWVAGSGYDAAPFFRIFNPTLQAKKFDNNADYIKKWVPELQALPKKYIFEPSKAPIVLLSKLGIKLGKTYPYPIVQHEQMRKLALGAYKKL